MAGDLGEAMRSRVLVCDGDVVAAAMLRGASARAVAEACVTDPESLRRLYREYRAAGADVLQTPTASTSAAHLELLGSAPAPADIWSSAVRLCRQEAFGAFVAATVGPPPDGPAAWAEADLETLYRRQIEVFADCAPDILLLRGLRQVAQLRAALQASCSSGIPLVVTVPADHGPDGADADSLSRALSQAAVGLSPVAVGATGNEASHLLPLLRALSQAMDLPLVAQWGPGAAEHTGREAAELIAAGARIVGGAAGMPPAQIALVARAAKALA